MFRKTVTPDAVMPWS